MSNLILVRHGQASFLEGDYDRLSSLGETQSRMLGEHWVRHRVQFDAVFTGPRLRQIRTAELVADAYAAAALKWPVAEILPELNEYDADSIMRALLPRLCDRAPRVKELAEVHESSVGTERYRSFQNVFEVVMKAWIKGEAEAPGVESWSEYCQRVRSGIERIRAGEAKGRRLVAFTSGGPIAVTAQLALGTSDETTLELNWQLRNCSLTEFAFSGARFSLNSFNALPHLPDDSLRSYR
jgi:broad specificity phosphatase PhoE